MSQQCIYNVRGESPHFSCLTVPSNWPGSFESSLTFADTHHLQHLFCSVKLQTAGLNVAVLRRRYVRTANLGAPSNSTGVEVLHPAFTNHPWKQAISNPLQRQISLDRLAGRNLRLLQHRCVVFQMIIMHMRSADLPFQSPPKPVTLSFPTPSSASFLRFHPALDPD